jgi:molecular chaperone HtpG
VSDSPIVARTKVDLGGLMKVLGEHLYSTPMVALRELVQNAHDSCHRRRIESDDEFTPRIEVRTNRGQRTLTIEDSGAGLTRDEIEKYLATVGAGYTRTLREGKRQGRRKDNTADNDGLIGFFGLGFLSAFVVAERTEVHTCSYQEPERAWLFSSRAGHSYTIRDGRPRPVGTAVILHLQPRFAELAGIDVVRPLLERYCCLLRFPVHCGFEGPVNDRPPPWRDPTERSPLRAGKLAMEFAQRFEPRFRPLCTMPVAAPTRPADTGNLDDNPVAAGGAGLLWIQDAATYGTSDNRNVWVFVRGMMVTDEDRELLPAWAGFVGAVVESDALVPTASRESLQKNDAYRQLQAQLHESLIAGLAAVAEREPESWQRLLTRHNEALLGAALADDRLFALLADQLTVPTSQGDLTVGKVLELAGGRLHISQSEHSGFEELLFRALKVPVVRGTRYAALPFCKRYSERERGTLVILGTGDDKAVFRPARLPAGDAARVQLWFAAPDAQVVPARFEPAHLPLILVPDREIELKRRMESDETRRSIAGAALRLAQQFTDRIADGPAARLYVNLECPAIQALLRASDDNRELALELLRAFASLSTEPQQPGRFMDVDEALERMSAAITKLLA